MFFDFSYKKRTYNNIAIIGCGTLGSSIAYLIAKKKIAKEMLLIDEDKVEYKNTTNQIYDPQDVGKYKVEVLKDRLSPYLNINIIKSTLTPINYSLLEGYEVVIDTSDSLYIIKEVFPLLKNSFLSFIKMRGIESMFGIIENSLYDEFKKIIKKKEENPSLSSQPVRIESSFFVASLFIHALAYSQTFNKLFFVNLSEINRIIDGVSIK